MWRRLCSFFIAALALLTVLSEMTGTMNLMTWVMVQRMGTMTKELDDAVQLVIARAHNQFVRILLVY